MKYKTTLFLLFMIALGGCQSVQWQAIDGASNDPAALADARKFCRIEAKLAGLARAEEARDRELRQADSNASKMLAREDYEQVRRQVWREIDICMARRGYRRPG